VIPFHYTKCSPAEGVRLLVTDDSSKRCHCPDLEERFKERFWGTAIYDEAMAAVEENRRLNGERRLRVA
jgi:hypothetical protein